MATLRQPLKRDLVWTWALVSQEVGFVIERVHGLLTSVQAGVSRCPVTITATHSNRVEGTS